MNALHELMKKILEIKQKARDLWKKRKTTDEEKYEKEIEETGEICEMVENSINNLVQDDTCDYDSGDSIGLAKFHIACALADRSVAENIVETVTDIDQALDPNSPLWPGYTALHFAAHNHVDFVLMLVERKANLLKVDSTGETAFDICIRRFSIAEVLTIFSRVASWDKISFSHGEVKLIDYIRALQHPRAHQTIMQGLNESTVASISENSTLWPGYSILHVTVSLLPEENVQMLEEVLGLGTDAVALKDINGSTPVHVAAVQNKRKFAECLLKRRRPDVDAVNANNISMMHIAAVVNDQLAMRKLLAHGGNDVNIAYKGKPLDFALKPDWTPLHVAAHANREKITRMLLASGADLLKPDSAGFTCAHLLLGTVGTNKLANLLLTSNRFEERVVPNVGLTHLHIASYFNHTEAIRRLLNLGSDVSARIGTLEIESLRMFDGCTALHLVSAEAAMKALVERGADILALAANGVSPLCSALDLRGITVFAKELQFFVEFVEKSDEQFVQRMKNELGLTGLHLACRTLDEVKVEALLEHGIDDDDVTTRVTERSAVWPGYTALHALVSTALDRGKNKEEAVEKIALLLLTIGADVSAADKHGDTPVHLLVNGESRRYGLDLAKVFLEQYENYQHNPVDRHGVSFFHVACLTLDVDAAAQWLAHGQVDVDQRVRTSSDRFPGQTALMIALNAPTKGAVDVEAQLRLVRLLVQHGADVHAVDARGWTPLHHAANCRSKRLELLAELIGPDTDVNRRSGESQTAFEVLLRRGASVEDITFFVAHGSPQNGQSVATGEGFIGIVMCSPKYNARLRDEVLRAMTSEPGVLGVNEFGRNAIHNAVACCSQTGNVSLADEQMYVELFENLMLRGCDIGLKDGQGPVMICMQDIISHTLPKAVGEVSLYMPLMTMGNQKLVNAYTAGKTPLHIATKFGNVGAAAALLICGADVNAEDSTGMSPLADYLHIDTLKTPQMLSFLYLCFKAMKHLNLELSEHNNHLLNDLDKSGDIQRVAYDKEVFLNELENAKLVQINGFSLYDVLQEKIKLNATLSSAAARQAMHAALLTVDYRGFHVITFILKLQCKKLLRRIPIVQPAAVALKSLTDLPDLCVNSILKYLDVEALQNVIVAQP